MFLLPNILPKTLEELARQPDESIILTRKEEEIKAKVLAAAKVLHPGYTQASIIIRTLSPAGM
jgi:hypothetical protein